MRKAHGVHTLEKSKYPERIGKKAGFPMAGKCAVNKEGRNSRGRLDQIFSR